MATEFEKLPKPDSVAPPPRFPQENKEKPITRFIEEHSKAFTCVLLLSVVCFCILWVTTAATEEFDDHPLPVLVAHPFRIMNFNVAGDGRSWNVSSNLNFTLENQSQNLDQYIRVFSVSLQYGDLVLAENTESKAIDMLVEFSSITDNIMILLEGGYHSNNTALVKDLAARTKVELNARVEVGYTLKSHRDLRQEKKRLVKYQCPALVNFEGGSGSCSATRVCLLSH